VKTLRQFAQRFLDRLLTRRRFVPETLRPWLKPLYRQWRQKLLAQELSLAVTEWKMSQRNVWQMRWLETSQADYPDLGRVLIVIVSYEGLDCLRLCLDSIWGNTDYSNYQVVVVDNASSPDILTYLQNEQTRHFHLRVVRNSTNLGFARANNIGLGVAEYEYAVLLNNDTVVTPGWLPRLIAHLEQDRTIGMIGPTTNWANNQSRISIPYRTLNDLEIFSQHYTRRHSGQVEEVTTLAMFCVVLPYPILQTVGLLDETFGLGMFEDDDYARRVRKAGYRLVVARDVFIHHWGWASFGNLSQAEYDRLFATNRAHFEAKWGPWQRPPLQIIGSEFNNKPRH